MFFLNLLNSVTKIFVISAKGLEPAISYVRDQDATTAPARHMWDTGSLNWPKFMLQWFIQFPEFPKFTKFLLSLRKTPLDRINTISCLVISDWTNERTNAPCYFMLTVNLYGPSSQSCIVAAFSPPPPAPMLHKDLTISDVSFGTENVQCAKEQQWLLCSQLAQGTIHHAKVPLVEYIWLLSTDRSQGLNSTLFNRRFILFRVKQNVLNLKMTLSFSFEKTPLQ